MCCLHYKEISPHQRLVLGDGKLVIDTWKTKKTNQTTPLINSRKNIVQERNVKTYNKYYEQYIPNHNNVNFTPKKRKVI